VNWQEGLESICTLLWASTFLAVQHADACHGRAALARDTTSRKQHSLCSTICIHSNMECSPRSTDG
jgi:hypothetical protein